MVGETGDHVAKQEGKEDIAVLHKGASKDFNNDQGKHDRESKTNVLWGTISKGNITVLADWSRRGEFKRWFVVHNLFMLLPSHFSTDNTASPVFHSSSNQRNS